MIELTVLFFSAFGVGFFASIHCLGMCGGIATAMAAQRSPAMHINRLGQQMTYSAGRVSSYILAGIIFSLFGMTAESALGNHTGFWLRIVSASLIVLLGLYISGLWTVLRYVENIGLRLWSTLSPLTRKLLPVDNYPKTFLVGALWGWLPCGLVYSTLLWAGTNADPLKAALIMGGFGLGTTPAIVSAGQLSSSLQHIARGRATRMLAGFLVCTMGLWGIYTSGHVSSSHQGHLPLQPDKDQTPTHSHATPEATQPNMRNHSH